MITKLLIASFLLALCVTVHAIGLMGALRWIQRSPVPADPCFWRPTWMLIRIAGWLILLHLIEISLWALLYAWREAMPDLHAAFYFSAVTYTTTGYGDLVLPEAWRLVGGIEALTGILMCGWSTGFFFAVVNRMYRSRQAETTGN
jgi:ion channel